MASMKNRVPDGGCIKITEGTYEQVFDKTGKLIASQFIAYESVYNDGDGSGIHPDDDRSNFYHPFDTTP